MCSKNHIVGQQPVDVPWLIYDLASFGDQYHNDVYIFFDPYNCFFLKY